MVILIVIIIVVLAVGIFIAGIAVGAVKNPATLTTPPKDTSAEDCAQACVAWDNARQMECNAKADEASARNRADALRTEMLAFIAAAVALVVGAAATFAAAATATATIFGIPLGIVLMAAAIALTVLAAAAFLFADFLGGQLISAETDATNKAASRSAWSTTVADARSRINNKCSPAEANACLSRTAQC